MVRKDGINTLIESKFDELKNAFVKFIKEMKVKMKKLLAEKFEKIKSETNKKMEELESISVMFQRHFKNLKRSYEELQKKCEEHEQYDRRLCLRIEGLTKKTKEDANDELNQVRHLFKEAEVEIPDAVLVRVRRISKENNDVIVIVIYYF